MDSSALDLGDVRAGNTLLALKFLWAEDVSRAELARRTGLSRSTVSVIVNGLIECGLLAEAGHGESIGGRRPLMLHLMERAALILALDLGARHVSVASLDLVGRILSERTVPHAIDAGPDETLSCVSRLVDEVLAATAGLVGARDGAAVLARVAMAGVGVPGPVEYGTGCVVRPPNMPGWDGVSVSRWLASRYPLPIFVDNDANVAALAEKRFGAGRGVDNLVYLKVATGIGAGLIVDGRLYRGARGGAGEVGHVSINESGPVGRSGNPGSLESYAAVEVIEAAVRSRVAAGEASRVGPDADVRAIAAAAHLGDALALSALREAGEHLGVAVSTLLNLFNPEMVVLGGRLAIAGDHVLEPLRRVAAERSLVINRSARVVPSELGPHAGVLGAGALALGELFSSRWLDRLVEVARGETLG